MNNKPLFITFEGIEACGKSTQAKMLNDYLIAKGQKVLLTREPGGPNISEKIRSILLDPENKEMTAETELLLYLASRNQHTAEWILPALNEGNIVICDRYFDSTFAYQGVARKIDLDIIKQINNFATFGLVPDITFVLDISVEMSILRQKGKKLDRMESESIDFHEAVRRAYLEIAKENNRYVIIDGSKNVDEIHEIVGNAFIRSV